VRRVCSIAGWARSSHYAPPRPARVLDEALTREATRIHARSKGSCGARVLSHALRHAGFKVGRARATTVMRTLGLSARKKRYKHYSRNTKPAPAENVVNQDFDPFYPNEVWAGDITFIPTREGWLYLAIVVDLFSRRIVGWATSSTPDTRLALAASELAFAMRNPPPGIIFHTDQGCQYTAALFVEHLAEHNALQSMSRKGNCWDNAVVERVFRSLKGEWIEKPYETRAEASVSVIDYLIRYYNTERLHSTLGYLSPVDFETLTT